MKLFISTGDVSGDFNGSLLIQALREQNPTIEFAAVGGEKVKESGAQILADSTSWSSIGFFDSLKKAPTIIMAYQRLKKQLSALKFNAAVLIDCPAFNLHLASFLFNSGIPIYYFFPPSAWKNDLNRAKQVGRCLKAVIAPFPESAALYEKAGVPVFFSGHPLVDTIRSHELKSNFYSACEKLKLNPDKPIIGLFPGSREQEIRYLLPILLKAGELLLEKFEDIQFVLPIASKNLKRQILSKIAQFRLQVTAVENSNYDILLVSTALIISSGTATLEAALYEKPMVIVYKVSPLTWKFERHFLKGVSFAGLPNLLLGRKVVPELIQEKAKPEVIFHELVRFLTEKDYAATVKNDLRQIRPLLGSPGVMKRVANLILEALNHA